MKKTFMLLVVLIFEFQAEAQTNDFPSSGNVNIYQSSSGYRAYDVYNRNGVVVSRFEATTDASGQLWLKDAAGNYQIALRSNTVPSSISGELIVGTYSTSSVGKKFYVSGDALISGPLTVGSNIAITNPQIQGVFGTANENTNVVWLKTNASTTYKGGRIEWNDSDGFRFQSARVDGTFYEDPGTVMNISFKYGGTVGIGVTNPDEKLEVNGTVRSKEVKVEASPWPDYVFDKEYQLLTLEETEVFINENEHLPNMPSAEEVEENGIALGEMNAKLLEKIEELTLHQIEMMKMLKKQQEIIDQLMRN